MKMPSDKNFLQIAVTTILFVIVGISISSQEVQATPNGLLFPVIGPASFSNDFYAYRSLGGVHHATDIFAQKGQKVVSATDGVITFVPYPQPSYGWMVEVKDSDGFEYMYIHLNNDNPGTDDGQGSPIYAYAPDMKQSYPIKRGQLIGYVGDSGNAESTTSHLHFEITGPGGNKINPYDHLPQAQRLFEPALYPTLPGENLPYGNSVGAPVNIASGNIDNDPEEEYVTGAGTGGGPHVRVFDNNDEAIDSGGFNAYSPSFRGGVTVAMGDINGDGIDEIVTGTGPLSSTHVGIFTKNGGYLGGFFAYPGYNTGVNVAAGDFDGDGIDEIVTSPGPWSSTHIKVFKPRGQEIASFFAYPGYNVGADIAVGDVVGDSKPEIITAAGPGGGSHIAIFDPTGHYLNGFFVYPGFYGGTKVDVGKYRNSTKADIATSPWSIGGPDIRTYDFYGRNTSAESVYEKWWSGGFDNTVVNKKIKVSTGGNRRSSIRTLK